MDRSEGVSYECACLELIGRGEEDSTLGLDFDIDEVLSSALRIDGNAESGSVGTSWNDC
jgi:hypothetical protein